MSRKVKINECGFDALLDLPGVGPKIAGQIIEERDHNRFTCIEDLQSIPRLRITSQLIDMVDFSEEPKMWGYDADALYARSAGFPKTERSLSDWSMGYQEPFRAPSYRFPPPQQRESEFRSFSDRVDRMTCPRNERQSRRDQYETETDDEQRPSRRSDIRMDDPRPKSGVNDTREGGQPNNNPNLSLPKTLKYDGKGSWQAFIAKFTRFAQVSGWSAKQCKDQLCWSVEGKASEFYAMSVERNQDIEYYDLINKFEKRFGYQELPETLQIQFMNAKQTVGESLEDWADRILSIATKAFRSLPEEHVDHQAIMKFCQGCADKEAGQQAALARPQSMEAAMDTVKWFQHNTQAIYGRQGQSYKQVSYSALPDERSRSPVAARVTNKPSATSTTNKRPEGEDKYKNLELESTHLKQEVTSIKSEMTNLQRDTTVLQKDNMDIKFTLSKMEAALVDIKRALNRSNRSPSRQRSRSSSPGQNRCFNCDQPGHYKRNCPRLVQQSPEKKVAFEDQANLNSKGSDKEA